MNQNLPVTRLSKKSPVSNRIALDLSLPVLIIKDRMSQQRNISLSLITGKGPPGSARSPGKRSHVFCNESFNPNLFTTMQIHSFNQIKTKHSFILKIPSLMKKQILFLAFLVFAIFSSLTDAIGQSVHYSAPRPLSCTPDALHPMAGQPWTYTATASVPGTYHFYATKDPSFIAATALRNSTALETPDDLLVASANYNNPGTTASATGTVTITWSSAILANTDYQGTPDATGATASPTFVAVYFASEDGCSDNFKVWELDPLHGFTVDVLAIDPDAVGTAPSYTVVPTSCFDNVESATYTNGAMVYNYGENYLYFEFVAANFTGSWTPTFAISGLNAVQTVTSYEYTTALPTAWDATTTWTPLVSGTTAISTTETNTAGGVSVFVRVLIDHANFEGTAGQTVTMTVDGLNSAGEWDVLNNADVDPCTAVTAADQNDTATSTFTPRPAIPAATATTSTLPTNQRIVLGNEAN